MGKVVEDRNLSLEEANRLIPLGGPSVFLPSTTIHLPLFPHLVVVATVMPQYCCSACSRPESAHGTHSSHRASMTEARDVGVH